MFNKIVIIGVGLIGGSLALALKKAACVQQIIGIELQPEKQSAAQQIVDQLTSDYAAALLNADLVLLAVPPGQMASVMQQIAPHLAAPTIISDVGSVKQDVIALAQQYLPSHLKQFVPAHPIAGAEKSGASAAQANLFQAKKVILTPLAETSAHAIENVMVLWQQCGAQVSSMSALEHDQILAWVSHLPHLLAFGLLDCIANEADKDKLMSYAGSGFQDFTRIGHSDPDLWRDICLANREALLAVLAKYQAKLAEMQRLLKDNDNALMH